MHSRKYNAALFIFLTCIFIMPAHVNGQTNSNFDLSLGLDFSAAEQTIEYFDYHNSDAQRIADLRGNRLAAATSIMLARTEKSNDDFYRQLEIARNNTKFESDVYGFSPVKNHIADLRKLLDVIKHRRLDRRIAATIAAFFPEQAKISTRFSVYFVVIGNDRATAFVRHVVWNYDVPTFVSEETGEPIIVVNLARVVEIMSNVDAQFLEVLSTTAHECFHAVFSTLQKSLSESVKPKDLSGQLLELVQNEGIAYYLSMQTHIGGETPSKEWFDATYRAIETLNKVLIELCSPRLTQARARELMMNANLSGSFEGNYGATAGLRMAYEIDKNLGRPALTQTLMGGGRSFVLAYNQACIQDAILPKIDKKVLQVLE